MPIVSTESTTPRARRSNAPAGFQWAGAGIARGAMTANILGEWTAGCFIFFFQAEDGIRDVAVTGVQTCALPISAWRPSSSSWIQKTGCASRWLERSPRSAKDETKDLSQSMLDELHGCPAELLQL